MVKDMIETITDCYGDYSLKAFQLTTNEEASGFLIDGNEAFFSENYPITINVGRGGGECQDTDDGATNSIGNSCASITE